ncbi:conserved hypothetical protein [Burkholderia sp. 8Y]|uniref:hypothetical protein n=1 Tax=Burkholderia sp. 8Y TaxID=2653133 RepID=UPI0012F0E503|nr:hypothetical protein [Burkholderia sp. 8Y]VXC80994.1 conserved hypothetical protein [Burkholderia sp. 8Y]
MPSPKWTFVSRFRRNAFGWRSSLPIQRLKEAVSEIRSVDRADRALAAEGAVLLLERLSPALEHVDSSSGALGSAVNRAIEALVPIIAAADVESAVRERWLERLFEALQDDQTPYIESLGEHWGSLCVTPELASQWADRLLPLVTHVLQAEGFNYFVGVVPCLSSLYAAGRFEEIIELVHRDRLSYWWYRRWAVDALVCLGRPGDALRLAEASRGLNAPESAIACACETILLASGMTDEAYERYAIAANRAGTYLATFRAITKKYPEKTPEAILSDLVRSEPGSEGKWFAAAKDAGLFVQAVALSRQSPTDPKTLIRAARDFETKQSQFAMDCALCALQWMEAGYGYEVTMTDVTDAYDALVAAARASQVSKAAVDDCLRSLIRSADSLVGRALHTRVDADRR